MKNLEAGAAIGAGLGKDDFGRIETRGIDIIPDVERKSKPYELFTVFFGPQFGYGNMIFGALAIAFGLGWWAAFWAITVGSLVGSLVFLAVTPISPKTGTNNQVSSGAAFGVRGRLLGSGITWFIAMGFFVILVYTSAQALIYTFNRWFGTSTGLGALSIAMAVIIVVTCVGAVPGHRLAAGGRRVRVRRDLPWLLARDGRGRVRGHGVRISGLQLRARDHDHVTGLVRAPDVAHPRAGLQHRQRGHVALQRRPGRRGLADLVQGEAVAHRGRPVRDCARADLPARCRHQLHHEPGVFRHDHDRHRDPMDGDHGHSLPAGQGSIRAA